MPRGKKGPVPEEREKKSNGYDDSPPERVLQCKQCLFNTAHLPEMTEHLAGSGHSDYEAVPVVEKQPELFAESAPIHRYLKVPINPEEYAKLCADSAAIAIQIVEQREIVTIARERGKRLEAEQNAIVAELKDPTRTVEVECVWRVNLEENSRTLIRLDNDVEVETKALSQEDREKELERVAAANAQFAGVESAPVAEGPQP